MREGDRAGTPRTRVKRFPFLFGGTFIEGNLRPMHLGLTPYFPSFSEGLSLRAFGSFYGAVRGSISLPFRRDFH